jgi:NDP-sugar pyrophosphorylase family protein
MNKTAMILAAGLGTRLKELTHDKPKALVEVAGKTLLQHNIENLVKNGFDTIVVNIHHFGNQVIEYLKNFHCDARIYISDERGALMDTGGGIVQALPFFHDTPAVLVHNVDILSDIDLQQYYDNFIQSNDGAWLLTQDRDTSRKLLFDDQNLLIGWKNLNDGSFKWVKGVKEQYKELAFNGMHIFKPSIFKEFEYQRYSIIGLYLQLAKSHNIRAKEIHPLYWFDIGKAETFNQINEFLIRNAE